MATINDVPDVILEFILTKVSLYQDIKNCSLVNRRWNECSKQAFRKRKEAFEHSLTSGVLKFSPRVVDTFLKSSSFSTPRFSHSACIVENDMFIFGGCSLSFTTFNDLWKVDLTSREMKRILAKSNGPYPTPKSHASMVVWNNCLVLFGGWTTPCVYPLHQQSLFFDELYIYSLSDNTWSNIVVPNTPPSVAGHSATVHDNVMVVFGGLQRRRESQTSSNEIYCFDLENFTWFRPRVSSIAPTGRYGHSQIKIDDRRILIMAGCGGVNNLLNDYWLLTLPQNLHSDEEWVWQQLSCEGTQPKRMWCYPACKVGDKIVVVGRNEDPDIESAPKSFQQPLLSSVMKNASMGNRVPTARNNALEPLASHPPTSSALEPPIHVSPPLSVLQHASHPRPSIRPNASSNRDLRLSMLSKHEERLREQRQATVAARALCRSHSSDGCRPVKSSCRQAVHVLSLQRLLTDSILTWIPGPSWYKNSAPHSRQMCTLLKGRAELIICAGRTGCDCNESDVLSPVSFITAVNSSPP